MNIDLSQLSPSQVYHTLTQTVIPRPIAWVLTEHQNGKHNLAPFSYFTAVSSSPPLLMFSAGKHKNGLYKDTVINAKRQEKLVIHIAGEDMAADVTDSASPIGQGESELELIDAELAEFDGFSLPRVKNCKLAFACSLHQVIDMGDTPMALVFAKVEHVYIDDEVTITDSKGRLKVCADKVRPLARLGGAEYADFGQIIKP